MHQKLHRFCPEELAENPVVREKYLGTNFVLRRKDFQLAEKDRQGKNGNCLISLLKFSSFQAFPL